MLNQSFQDFEVVILDDNSSDDSRTIIESYSDNSKISHVMFNDVNSGSTFSQWELGIKLAKGKFIWIAESDDYADRDFLRVMMASFKKKNVALAYCRSYRVLDNEQKTNTWGEVIKPELWNHDQIFDGNEFIKSFLKFRNVIPNASSVVFKKEYFDGCQDLKKMSFAGDWLVWISIAQKGKIYYCSQALNYFRQHASTSRSLQCFQKEIQRIKEYFIAIDEACKKVKTEFNPTSIGYDWIIDQWIVRSERFGLLKSLFPPYPFLFLLRFYKKLFSVKIAKRLKWLKKE